MSKINLGQIGYDLSVALRKYCDSTPTTIAYKAVHLMDDSWNVYCKFMKENLLKEESPTWEDIKEFSIAFEDSDEYSAIKDDKENSYACILILSFRLFSDSDWQNYSWGLFNE